MKKGKKKLISNRVLRTELSYAIECINTMDFGFAKKIIAAALARVMEYDLTPGIK